ncbi:Gfo/Idh/MocA family protein [Halioxenophilus aromaticivorans]|uniref:Gfo/Idh/MocA family oxidoreductase n=1 Tax=Halioxenophilus aromaticivorans TaxID=1306992 RepID=A0AAV3TZE2_9ALTE
MKFQTLSPLKLGFIGGGCNSAVGYAHYCAAQLDGEWQLAAGSFSRDERVNAITARQYGVAPDKVYADWQMLLEREAKALDAVVILTPTPEHEAMVCAALSHGLAVICEKSLTPSLAAAKRVRAVCEREQGRLLVTYNYSAYPQIRELQARIESGQLGAIHHVQVEMPQEGFARLQEGGKQPSPQAWRLEDQEIPTLHLDLTTHLHHLVYFLTGQRPLEVMADHNSFGWFPQVIDDATAVVKYSGDMTARYWVSKSSLGYKNGLRIHLSGSLGSAQWVQSQPEELTLNYVDGRREIIERGSPCLVANQIEFNRFKAGHPAGFIEAFANLYREFAMAIRHPDTSKGRAVYKDYGLTPAIEGLALMQAMTQSHNNRQWENLHGKNSTVAARGQRSVKRSYPAVATRGTS